MIVYGKYKQKYVLSAKPVSQDHDGAIYTVPGNPDIKVKIYRPEFRNSSMEKQVIDTANGTCSMLDEFPTDVVYSNGRFAGYIFEDAVEEAPLPDPIPLPPVKTGMSEAAIVLIGLGVGIAISLLIYYVLFGVIADAVGETYAFWNFKGVPMILGGWALMVLTFLKFRDQGNATLIASLVAFPVGVGLVFGVICLLVWLIAAAFSMLEITLPILLLFALLIWAIRRLIRGR